MSNKKKQKRGFKPRKSKKQNNDSLKQHNTLGYLADLRHICKLGYIDDSKRDWIETTMLRLRDSANKYEKLFGDFLLSKNIDFIHQAPFIFSGKIYFADFYIPKLNLIIEIDGQYHDGLCQREYDRFRDECFNGNKLNVLRIPNSAVLNKNDLRILVAEYIK